MTPEEIAATLTELFSPELVKPLAPGSWQIDNSDFRLLVLLSEDHTWLRILLPIIPLQEAEPFLTQFLEANFDDTQETRYAVYDGVLWGVFQHNSGSLSNADFTNAIARLISLHQAGINDVFSNLVENRIREIVQASKQQGLSLETTMQNLDRFYAEGLLGDLNQNAQAREQILAAWRHQLVRLWGEM
ncbi:MAG: hypothetical protein ACKO3K_18630 [Cuspidothrix sp.]